MKLSPPPMLDQPPKIILKTEPFVKQKIGCFDGGTDRCIRPKKFISVGVELVELSEIPIYRGLHPAGL